MESARSRRSFWSAAVVRGGAHAAVLALVASACASGSKADDAAGNSGYGPGGGDAGAFDDAATTLRPLDGGSGEGAEDATSKPMDSGTHPTDAGAADATNGKDAGDASAEVDATADAAPDTGPVVDACAQAIAGAQFTFDNGAEGWTNAPLDGMTSNAGWPFDEWAQGTSSFGPGCHSGACWATNLTENYAECERGELSSPAIDLSACTSKTVSLTFWHAYDFWSGKIDGTKYNDGGIVELSSDGGSTWTTAKLGAGNTYPGTVSISPEYGLSECTKPNSFHVNGQPGYVGGDGTWEQVTIPIPASMLTSSFMIRFSYGTGDISDAETADDSRDDTDPGWHLDDVSFAAK